MPSIIYETGVGLNDPTSPSTHNGLALGQAPSADRFLLIVSVHMDTDLSTAAPTITANGNATTLVASVQSVATDHYVTTSFHLIALPTGATVDVVLNWVNQPNIWAMGLYSLTGAGDWSLNGSGQYGGDTELGTFALSVTSGDVIIGGTAGRPSFYADRKLGVGSTVAATTNAAYSIEAHAFGGFNTGLTTDYTRNTTWTNSNFRLGAAAISLSPAGIDTSNISDIDPATGDVVGGTAVTVTGEGFTGATGVTFGGVAATSFVLVSDTQITCVTPAAPAGLVDVAVLRPTTNLTAVDGFEYTVSTARVTQAPIISVIEAIPSVRITQVPILILSLEERNTRITQAPVIMPYLQNDILLPGVFVPEMPITEKWQWLTIITQSEKGFEQRNALRNYPRINQTVNVVLTDMDNTRETVYQVIMRMMKRPFVFPIYQHATKLTQSSDAATNVIYFDALSADIRNGDKAAILDGHTETIRLVDVLVVAADGAILAEPLDAAVGKHCFICPALPFAINTGSVIKMNSVEGEATIELNGLVQRAPMRPNQATNLLTFIDGILFVDKRPLANESVDEQFNQSLVWYDNQINTPNVKAFWDQPQLTGVRQFFARDALALDYWRAALEHLKGRQKPFLLPTYRSDIALSAVPALGAAVLETADFHYSEYWQAGAWRYARIQSDAGVVIRRVDDVRVIFDANGVSVGASIHLNDDIGSTVGSNTGMIISFVNLCRLNDDTVAIDHTGTEHFINLDIGTVNR